MEQLNSEKSEEFCKIETTVVESEQSEQSHKTSDSLGKFKDVKSLLNAYNSLEAEFTRRSQRLKELDGNGDNSKRATPNGKETDSNLAVENSNCEKIASPEMQKITANRVEEMLEETENQIQISEEVKEKILNEYLLNLAKNKQNYKLIGDVGNHIASPVHKPKSLNEASALALEYFRR